MDISTFHNSFTDAHLSPSGKHSVHENMKLERSENRKIPKISPPLDFLSHSLLISGSGSWLLVRFCCRKHKKSTIALRAREKNLSSTCLQVELGPSRNFEEMSTTSVLCFMKYIKRETQCLITKWNNEKRVENTTCSVLLNFEVFRLEMKKCVKCLILVLKENDFTRRN